MADAANPRKFKTPPFRGAFVYIPPGPPKKHDDGKERWELTALFPPGSDISMIPKALKAAMVEKHGPDPKTWPKLKRGKDDIITEAFGRLDKKGKPLEGFDEGWTAVAMGARLEAPPGVVGSTKGSDGKFPVITDPREVYSGRWMRVTGDAFYYEKSGRGVSLGMQNVQLLKNDKKWAAGGGGSKAEEDFEDADPAWAGTEGWGEEDAPTTEKPDAAEEDWG